MTSCEIPHPQDDVQQKICLLRWIDDSLIQMGEQTELKGIIVNDFVGSIRSLIPCVPSALADLISDFSEKRQ
jgi:hypothetical protein